MSNMTVVNTIIPVCLFCSIEYGEVPNRVPPNITDGPPFSIFGLPEALESMFSEDITPEALADLLAKPPGARPPGAAPVPSKLRSNLDDNSIPKLASVFTTSPVIVRQASPSVVQQFLGPLAKMLRTLVPQLRERPQAAPEPSSADVPASHKNEKKDAQHDHKHVEVSQSNPEGVVSGGSFYEGYKANGEYFNEEKQEADSLEIHSHEDVSPGKIYDEKSEHPHYFVDRPAEGPAPPPIQYFTPGLRSEPDVSAWNDYYAKLKAYNDFYYPNYRRERRTTDENKEVEVDGSVEAVNQVANKIDTKYAGNIDRVLALLDQPADA